MASRSALSTAPGGLRHVGSKFRDSLFLLDVLYADQYDGEIFNQQLAEETEENFYKGAPPNWLNFHTSEHPEFKSGFIQRDGFETLKNQIVEKSKLPAVSAVKLFHQPGSGGTTMAMQVLWDLRKTFRCAVLTDSTSDITKVAKEVVFLYTAGDQGHQNTVLLLVNDEHVLDKLQDSIMLTIAEQEIVTRMPVAILLSCVRKDVLVQKGPVVLQRVLSDAEEKKFKKKKKELIARYGEKIKLFHGFNIMQSNFSQDYIKQACEVFSSVRKANRPQKTQLAAYLSLLNAYVPGSYLLESQCLDFLNPHGFVHGDLTVKELMQPYGDLIITFQQDERSERKVRMAHPMIAKCCTELMAAAGVTRSDTARNFLNNFCKYAESDEFPQCVLGFVKDMLTKREMKTEDPVNTSDSKENQERFSRLILDIHKMEGSKQSASVLKVASKKFKLNPFFPQALARFYYIELKDYNQAEIWAKRANERDPQNSFVADTLGQVHKNHLNSKGVSTKPREILQLAEKAINAFKHEEQLADAEQEPDMNDDSKTKVFNSRGLFGFLQVCNILYDKLVHQNNIWRDVLTQAVSLCSVLDTLGDNKIFRFNDLIKSLRPEVERKCDFFDKYLTYSKLNIEKDDPEYISKDTLHCHRKFVGDSPHKQVKQKIAEHMQKLKQKLADTTAGVLACLDREHTESDLKEITTWWKEICSSKNPGIAVVNYIFAHIILMNTGGSSPLKRKPFTTFREKIPLKLNDPPEQHMLALLLYWPSGNEDRCIFDLSQLIQQMHCSYENTYKKHFRLRYLRPLFFLGKGQELNRTIHRKVLEMLFYEENQETKPDWSYNWRNENIFKNSAVQDRLLKVEGVVRNYRVYASVGGTEIEVEANLQRSLWRSRKVSFYLGFTIRGPVAFDIQTKTEDKGPSGGLLEARAK
ncbi:sterile alpha motif domain-containing protein 9-like [Melanotaenia boesemani]|uniref:sterile alpha motif domain-containing protein 9-like n=1 Tax=Melanotaenia boesemani TaxID=1250792 RepID=UPI001C05A777|nr:sterile alpha motif domain-containing protein 9-like [Melanotaenia boesemani]